MSVQAQLRDYRSLQSQNYGGPRGGSYFVSSTRNQTVGLNAKQASNPNPKIIPAPIPSNLVPYRKEDSLKKLQEEDGEEADDNPQYQEFLARRDKQAQIPSSLSPSYGSTTRNDEPWFLKKPTVRVGDPVLISSSRGWLKAKIATIKNGRIGVAETINGGWRYWRRAAPTTILYYDFESPFWKYDGKRLVSDPKDVGRQASEKARREEERNRYSYSYSSYTPAADPPATEEQPVKFKVRRVEPIYYQSPKTGCYVYNQAGPADYGTREVHHKEKIVLPSEKHESHKRHSFFKNRNMKQDSENDESSDSLNKSIAEVKLERDRKRGEMIEQRIFCHLDKKQLDEFKHGKLKLNDLPALRPLLFDIEVDLDKQNIVYPDDNEGEYEVNEVIMDGPVDEQHLAELNKAFFDQFGSASTEDNGIVYADDGRSDQRDDELSRFDIRGSQCSYSMDVPSLSSSSSTELDPDAFHIRPANDDFSLDSFHVRANYYDDYNAFHVKKNDEELTLEAFNIVLGDPEEEARNKLDQVQTIKPEAHNYGLETSKKYVEEEEYKPVVETHKIVKTMDLKLDYFIDILDTRTGQIRCEMGPKLVEICGYEDVVKGPERLY